MLKISSSRRGGKYLFHVKHFCGVICYRRLARLTEIACLFRQPP